MSADFIIGRILNILHAAEMSLQISDLIQSRADPVEYVAKLFAVKPMIGKIDDKQSKHSPHDE